jgi:hypothetical protein
MYFVCDFACFFFFDFFTCNYKNKSFIFFTILLALLFGTIYSSQEKEIYEYYSILLLFFLQDLLLICYFVCYLLTLYQLFASLHFVLLQYVLCFLFYFLCVFAYFVFVSFYVSRLTVLCHVLIRIRITFLERGMLYVSCSSSLYIKFILTSHHTYTDTLLVTLSVSWDQEPPT